jgi:hypothetical protein
MDVIETCTRLGWHVDRREWAQLADVLAGEVHVDYTSLAGGTPGVVRGADLIASWRELFDRLAATQHLITNHLVDVDGDAAVCTAQFHAQHVAAPPHGDSTLVVAGHYRFGLARDPSGWRINSIVMTTTWSRGNLAVIRPALLAET